MGIVTVQGAFTLALLSSDMQAQNCNEATSIT